MLNLVDTNELGYSSESINRESSIVVVDFQDRPYCGYRLFVLIRASEEVKR